MSRVRSPSLDCPLDPRPCAGVRRGTTLVALSGGRRESNYPVPTTLAEALVLLAEAEDTLQAIAAGDVDAVVVADNVSRRVFALTTADRTYRMFVENMRDGAATVSADGLVVYANQRLAELLRLPRELIVGVPLTMFVAERLPLPETGTHGAADLGMTVEADLVDGNGSLVPVLVGISRLDVDSDPLLCLTFTDLSDKEAQDREIARLSSAQAVRMTELQEAQAALTQQATHDALTGLANRVVLVERIEQALSNSLNSGRCTAVFFVDLDRFKQVNDTRGHAAGDTVLRRVAEQLVSLLRPTDTVARIGGDEFVVLAPDIVSSGHALQLAGRLAAELCRRPNRAEDGEHIAASIGIAFSVGGGTTAEALLHDADTAMYEAKSRGGARAVVYDTSFDEIVQQRSITQRMIALAIDEDRVVVHYQPILDLADLRIVGFEALARISDVDGVILPPASFINVAEECGLIVPIGSRVLDIACDEARRWQGHARAGCVAVAVNLSARQFEPGDLAAIVRRQLERTGLAPEHLHLELTETAIMDLRPDILGQLAEIRELGVQIGLDDFGTGYASLTHLRRLPLSFVKIDRSFVEGIGTEESDERIVSAVIDLAAKLGLRSVAEGVETVGQLERLQEFGCDQAQGYFFTRPIPPHAVPALIEHGRA